MPASQAFKLREGTDAASVAIRAHIRGRNVPCSRQLRSRRSIRACRRSCERSRAAGLHRACDRDRERLLIGIPTGHGTFRYDAPTDTVVLDWPADAAANVYQRVTNAYESTFGSTLEPNIKPMAVSQRTTLHPLGGMPLGLATDEDCQVKGYDGLYVVDGSIVPNTSAVANPSFLITALAERCMAKIAKSIAHDDKHGHGHSAHERYDD